MDYELLDFGNGRKLERFGSRVLDRPCPAAEGKAWTQPAAWDVADARFQRQVGSAAAADEGHWTTSLHGQTPNWSIRAGQIELELKLTPFGHVGVFPEQQANWDWIGRQVRVAVSRQGSVRLLNLFAYTGASTLAAAAAGAVVAHVDASRPVVQWARANATSSSLQAATIRWLVEDAQRFVQREIRRGNRYDALVLDPPSYGHGPKGERWRVTHDLLPLLEDCRKLLPERPACVLLTCHSPGYGPAELAAVLQEAMFGRCTSDVTAEDLYLKTSDGRRLHAGVSARFPAR